MAAAAAATGLAFCPAAAAPAGERHGLLEPTHKLERQSLQGHLGKGATLVQARASWAGQPLTAQTGALETLRPCRWVSRGAEAAAPRFSASASLQEGGGSGDSSNTVGKPAGARAGVLEHEAHSAGPGGDEEERQARREPLQSEPAVRIEVLGANSRRVTASIGVEAPLQAVWGVLTDYERLGNFIPSLAVNEVVEKRATGARLLQVGQQDLALGLKFRARAVVDVEEEGGPLETERSDGQDGAEVPERCLRFTQVEGDFKLFRGTWRMLQISDGEELGRSGPAMCKPTSLTYTVEVTPQRWLPVGLVEGRLSRDICSNLASVQGEAVHRYRLAVQSEEAGRGS